MATKMSLKAAFAVAIREDVTPQEWQAAEKAIIAAGYCPHCACDGEHSKLGRHEEATHESYAGRECPACEEFVPDVSQPADCWERGDYGGALGADGSVHSDAVSGF